MCNLENKKNILKKCIFNHFIQIRNKNKYIFNIRNTISNKNITYCIKKTRQVMLYILENGLKNCYFLLKIKIPQPYLQSQLRLIRSSVKVINLCKSPLSSTYEKDSKLNSLAK